MAEDIAGQVREAGVVGAGGAGFPAHVKLAAKAEIALVNAAECEPLLHKDKVLLQHGLREVLQGLRLVMTSVGATRGLFGIKEKHQGLIETLRSCIDRDMAVVPVKDFYPAGDEITLIYETTGRVVQAGELPGSQGVVVNNVETLYNIGRQQPVTSKFLNIAGEVDRPVTVQVPIGISLREVLDFAGAWSADSVVIEGGPMMGKLVTDLEQPVTKTTAALLVMPKDHILPRRLAAMNRQQEVDRVGRSACDQCVTCTELCPRYLLGHPIQPHRAMRSLLFRQHEKNLPESHTLYCCECNLCSLVSCPEALSPSMVCSRDKAEARKLKLSGSTKQMAVPHPLRDYRRVPSKKLKSMLDLNRFDDVGPLVDFTCKPEKLTVLLRQHIGKRARPLVVAGERVSKGQKLATMGSELGSEIHAPETGIIEQVTGESIILRP